MDVERKNTLILTFGGFFVGCGFPAFIFGILLDNIIETVGGLVLTLIGIYLIASSLAAEATTKSPFLGE